MNLARARDVKEIVMGLEKYWGLTVRQVYYQLISSPLIQQNHWFKYGDPAKGRPKDIYLAMGILLKWMRIYVMIPWKSINDEHRIKGEKPGWDDEGAFLDFVKEGINDLCENYRRCNSQNQENYIEVWLEKAALQHIVKEVTNKYCKRLVVNRGYSSITFLNNYRNRARQAVKQGLKPVVLYYGDWDPSGENMLYAGYQTLCDELEFPDADFYRGALNPDQLHLIKADPVILKQDDKRTEKFEKKYGSVAFELDALHPVQLQEIVEKDILSITNMETLRCEIGIGQQEAKRLKRLPGIIEKVIHNFKGGGVVRTRFNK